MVESGGFLLFSDSIRRTSKSTVSLVGFATARTALSAYSSAHGLINRVALPLDWFGGVPFQQVCFHLDDERGANSNPSRDDRLEPQFPSRETLQVGDLCP